jgi:hypothetical protein
MAKEPRATDSTTPKTRTRKPATEPENGTKVAKAAKAAARAKQEVDTAVVASRSLEEKVRIRAYELYLQRGGNGGSPEQDWFQAVAEVYGQSVA